MASLYAALKEQASQTMGMNERQYGRLDAYFARADYERSASDESCLVASTVYENESYAFTVDRLHERATNHMSDPLSSVVRPLSLAAGLALICFGLWNLRTAPQREPLARGLESTPVAGPATESTETFELVPVDIETVRLGMRGAGQNPLSWQVSNDAEPTPETHREVRFEMLKPSGKRLWMRFIWPLEQIAASGASPGKSIHFDPEEMGVHGMATCTFVGPCPDIQGGPGNVVTGLFEHETDPGSKIYTIDLADGSSIAGVTGEHPIWSETDGDFVAAEHLRPGTMLLTRAGPVSIESITDRTARPGERVYNLQIHGQHVYQVTASGVLVHHTYGPGGLSKGRIQDYLSDAGSKTPQQIAQDLQAAGLKLKGQSPDGRFMEFVDRFGNVRAKIHPADKVTPYAHLHIYDKAGNALSAALKKVSPKLPDAHLPIGN